MNEIVILAFFFFIILGLIITDEQKESYLHISNAPKDKYYCPTCKDITTSSLINPVCIFDETELVKVTNSINRF